MNDSRSHGALSGLSRIVAQTLAQGGRADALEYREQWHSWAELADLAGQIREVLEQECPGALRIGLIARNTPVVLAAMLGLIAGGHTVVMLHGAQTPERLAREIAELKLAAITGEDDFWHDEVREAAAGSGTLRIGLPGKLTAKIQIAAASAGRAAENADPAVALELLSSGTTGAPKRIAILWRTLEQALGTAHGTALFGADARPLSGQHLPPAISGLSLGNIGGVYMMLPSVLIGQRIVMLDKFAVEPWVRAVRKYKPEILSVQPAGLRMILEAGVAREDLASISTIVSGASRLDPELQSEFEERYDVRVFGAYGATETCGSIIVWTDDLYDMYRLEKRGSVGKPIAGVTIRIVDPGTGRVVSAGTTGLLHAKVDRVGPHWIETTDLAYVDEDGFVFVTGRADNAIDRGGYSIPPDIVADVLRRHPAVRDACVVGLPDDRLGAVPVAAVELTEGFAFPGEAELIDFARGHLLSYQVPVRILCVDELPRNASLKVLEPDVRAMFE